MLRGQLHAQEARKQPARRPLLSRLLRRPAATPAVAMQSRDRRSDLIVASLGVALGLGCALFPWYIFFNQEKFGIRALKFGGQEQGETGPVYLGSQHHRIGEPMSVEDIPPMQLDLFATGTLPSDSDRAEQPPAEQPFPAEIVDFRLVHVANGRAMIQDDSGLWVVQRGSTLPDSSRVAGIEQRDGKWVVITNTDRVIEISK